MVRYAILHLERLESRLVPSGLEIMSITRTASMSLLDRQIRDGIALTPAADDTLTGQTAALVGYQVPQLIPPFGLVSLGGMGLEIAVKMPTGTTTTLTVTWGDGSADNFSTSGDPLFVFPHSYLATGNYSIGITAVDGGDTVKAQIGATIDHVLETRNGVFVRGRQGQADTITLTPVAGGAVKLTGNLLTYTTTARRLPIYIDTLSGDDIVTARPTLTRSLWVDAGAGNDQVVGGAGNDRIRGADGDDQLSGGGGADLIFGDAGQDVIHGGPGNDSLHGGSSDDALTGDAGNDVLFGDQGADELHGGGGNDFLLGLGADMMFGEAGNGCARRGVRQHEF